MTDYFDPDCECPKCVARKREAMTDQPNTGTDAEVTDAMVDAGVEKWIALSGITIGANPVSQLREPCREIVRAALTRRAVAPAPAEDVEQRVAEALAFADHKERVRPPCASAEECWKQYLSESGRANWLLLARAALAAMPSGRQRGLLEAAEMLFWLGRLHSELHVAWQGFGGGRDEGSFSADLARWKDEAFEWHAAIHRHTAAAQLGEPQQNADASPSDDGWRDIRELLVLVADEYGGLPGSVCEDEQDDEPVSHSMRDGKVAPGKITFGHIRRAVAALPPVPSVD